MPASRSLPGKTSSSTSSRVRVGGFMITWAEIVQFWVRAVVDEL